MTAEIGGIVGGTLREHELVYTDKSMCYMVESGFLRLRQNSACHGQARTHENTINHGFLRRNAAFVFAAVREQSLIFISNFMTIFMT